MANRTETPRGDDADRRVTSHGITFHVSESEAAARTTVDDMSAYILNTQQIAEESFRDIERELRVKILFTCRPEGHEIKLALDGEASEAARQEFHDALTGAKKLPVRADAVIFELDYSIKPLP